MDPHRELGVGGGTPALAHAYRMLLGKGGFSANAAAARSELKTFVTAGTLPAGATITVAVFQRALLVLAAGLYLPGETDDNSADSGA